MWWKRVLAGAAFIIFGALAPTTSMAQCTKQSKSGVVRYGGLSPQAAIDHCLTAELEAAKQAGLALAKLSCPDGCTPGATSIDSCKEATINAPIMFTGGTWSVTCDWSASLDCHGSASVAIVQRQLSGILAEAHKIQAQVNYCGRPVFDLEQFLGSIVIANPAPDGDVPLNGNSESYNFNGEPMAPPVPPSIQPE